MGAEFSDGDAKSKAAESARLAYEEAHKVAEKDLAVTHPIRLGLALNYSVFQYEVLQNPDEACKMARTAFEDAIAELDNVQEDSYKDFDSHHAAVARQPHALDIRPGGRRALSASLSARVDSVVKFDQILQLCGSSKAQRHSQSLSKKKK